MSSAAIDLSSVEAVSRSLGAHNYLADQGLATSVFLALTLKRPLLLEGEAGVGKTELAKVLASLTGGELIRLQCYEGIDATQACRAVLSSCSGVCHDKVESAQNTLDE